MVKLYRKWADLQFLPTLPKVDNSLRALLKHNAEQSVISSRSYRTPRITTELQHTKKRIWFACILQQTIQRRCGVYLARHMRQLQAAGAPPASGKRPNDKSIANKKNETSKKNNQGTSNNNQSITNEHETTRTTNQLTCTVASITLVCSAGSIGTWAATPTSRNSVRDVPNASDSLWQTDKLRVSSWKGVNWGGLIAHSN